MKYRDIFETESQDAGERINLRVRKKKNKKPASDDPPKDRD
jgi:hypothetical protein